MRRALAAFYIFFSAYLSASDERGSSYPSFAYDVARAHELKPHRRSIPISGVQPGFNQLRITVVVSAEGHVVDAKAGGEASLLAFWPRLRGEVFDWRFVPFKEGGKTVTAEVEEYIDLVPPERSPTYHVPPPVLGPNSDVILTLQRTGCYGSCPSYTVTVNTEKIAFEGHAFVVAHGLHTEPVRAADVRKLARRFLDSDFYSMDDRYAAAATDLPTYVLSMEIDGQRKKVVDYAGAWVGMPAVITGLEDEMDQLTGTQRWIEGGEGLVQQLEKEGFAFRTFEAQVMLKEAARRGKTATVGELLKAGVPLAPLPAPKPKEPYNAVPFEHVGWLKVASEHPDTLRMLIEAGASRHDQNDKDLALGSAARSGSLGAVRALIAYGANPKVNLGKLLVTTTGGGVAYQAHGAASLLIYAAESGSTDVVMEILRYHPNLEARDREGRTALFKAGEYRNTDQDGAQVEIVRLLAGAGADVNARDQDGNTPLHETFLTDVEEELLKLGANVNARNHDGETPIFTTVDDDAIPLFIRYGADLSIRNNAGQTVVEAAAKRGPGRQAALAKAIRDLRNK